jgi:hypothetical protein
MKKYLTLALIFSVIAMLLPACASNQTDSASRASSANSDSRVVNKVGRRNIPVVETRGSSRIPDQ